ncbi:MAG: DUF2130 domain-containing protein [Bacilli bacterium]
MNTIKCPKCGTVFTLNESDYESIAKQVRDDAFQKDLKSKEELIEDKYKASLEAEKIKNNSERQEEISSLKIKLASAESNLKLKEQENESKIVQAQQSLEKEVERLKQELKGEPDRLQLAVTQAISKQNEEIASKRAEIIELNNKIKDVEKDAQIDAIDKEKQYQIILKTKDEQIEQLKDMKMRLSTKMVGETLEQHCQTQFNSLRTTAFKNAYFEKDNDVKDGSKGDFIFKDYTDDETEFISIMFEMKNENDETVTKHKNEDFFKELDKDRKEKGCEYAILVSMLEPTSELYNNGIVDVSYRYPKMYVIRPQFFIPIISLLRNAALSSVDYQKQLIIAKNENLDITHFEEQLDDFKIKFGRNCRLASEKFQEAIKRINDTINNLGRIRDELMASDNNLRLANDKAEDLTIKA